MSYRAIALEVIPEIQSLANEILSVGKIQEADIVSKKLLGSRDDRVWAIATATLEVGLDPSRPLMYWSSEMKGLPRNTRDCVRYLGDYVDLLVKEMTQELLGGNARRRSLGSNTKMLVKNAKQIRELSIKLEKFSDYIYTPGKHDFSLPPGRKHSFTAKEVIYTAYMTAALAKEILLISKNARYAVESDNLYTIGGKWGSTNRVHYEGE
jgi:hypothetical protein